jgi:predicted LPLAT superfamily acyltransferase
LADKNSSWRGKTGGGNFGQLALFQYFRFGSITLAYCIMSCAIFFYLIINYQATRNIYSYFRSKHRYSIFKSAISTYRNHYLFGKTLIDKFAFFAGKRDKYSVELINNEFFTELDTNVNCGALLLQSHVGSSELAGYFFSKNTKNINAIIFGGESPVFQKYRSKLLMGHNVRLIPVTDGFSEVFEINNALANNNFVSLTADRIYKGSKNIEINFLGSKAEFPLAPFKIAVKLHVPVLALFVMQNGYKKYCCYVYKIEAPEYGTLNPETQVEMLAQTYVASLEQIVKKYPLQWYNFHKFWL